MDNLSFCKFNFQKNVKKVIWEITNQCNYTCEYCIFSSTGKKPNGELSFEEIKKTLNELKTVGFNYIKFTGGEPFIREDFIQILEYAKSLNFNFDISTNASFVNEEISKKISLLNPNFIHVSLDGHDQYSHDFVRGKKSFNKTIKGLTSLLKHNRNIRIGSVIHSQNDSDLEKIVNLANEFNVKEIIFSIMSPIGRMDKNSPSISSKNTQELIKIITSIKSSYTKVLHNLNSDIKVISFKKNQTVCPGGQDFLFIDSLGTVSPCTWVSEKFPEFHLLSLKNNSLIEILENNLFKDFNYEKSLLNGRCFAFAYEPKNKFNQIYSFSTENIEFISKLPFKKNYKKALVITGSGDQAITLSNQGFNNITCIDINYLAKLFTELKIAALKILPFDLFVSFFKNNEVSFTYKSYKKFSYLLSSDTQKFWNQQYINVNYQGNKIRTSNLFNLKHDDYCQKILNVKYLQSEQLYLNIQKNIKNCNFNFITENFIKHEFNESFDVILLSNISDYSHKMFEDDYLKSFKTFWVEKSLSLLNQDGILMFAYIYDFENIGNSSLRNKINLPLIRKMYFNEFNYKEILIKSAISDYKNDVACYTHKGVI